MVSPKRNLYVAIALVKIFCNIVVTFRNSYFPVNDMIYLGKVYVSSALEYDLCNTLWEQRN